MLNGDAVPKPYYADSDFNSESDDELQPSGTQLAGLNRDQPKTTFSYTNALNGVYDIDHKINYLHSIDIPKQEARRVALGTLIEKRQDTVDRLCTKLNQMNNQLAEQLGSKFKQEMHYLMENDGLVAQLLRQQLIKQKGLQKNIYSAEIIDMAIHMAGINKHAYYHLDKSFNSSLPTFDEVEKFRNLLQGKKLTKMLWDADPSKVAGKTWFDGNLEQVDPEECYLNPEPNYSDDSDDYHDEEELNETMSEF